MCDSETHRGTRYRYEILIVPPLATYLQRFHQIENFFALGYLVLGQDGETSLCQRLGAPNIDFQNSE